jgi:hypothetical protein
MTELTIDHGTFYAHELATYQRDNRRSLDGYRFRRAVRLGICLPNRVTEWMLLGVLSLPILVQSYA